MTSVARNRGGRPAQISREKVLEAAAALPLDDLSMSAVAQRLGVTHASLYAYFPSRAALVAAVLLDLGEQMDVPDPQALAWEDWVVAAGVQCRDHAKAHLAATGHLRSGGLDAVLGPLMRSFIEVFAAEGFTSLATADAWGLFRGCCLNAASDARRVEAIDADPALVDVWGEVAASFMTAAPPATIQFVTDVSQHLDLEASFRRQLVLLVRAWRAERDQGRALS